MPFCTFAWICSELTWILHSNHWTVHLNKAAHKNNQTLLDGFQSRRHGAHLIPEGIPEEYRNWSSKRTAYAVTCYWSSTAGEIIVSFSIH